MTTAIGEPVELEGEEFFHFQPAVLPYWGGTRAEPWVPGLTLAAGTAFGLYAEQFEFAAGAWTPNPAPEGRRYLGLGAIRHVLNVLHGRSDRIPDFDAGGAYGVHASLEAAERLLDGAIKLGQELVWEQIRLEAYPRLPSRRTCLFALEPTEAAGRHWQFRMGQTARPWRVRLSGRAHRADPRWLASEPYPISELRERSHLYWSGVGGGQSPEDELLFEGTVEVLEALPPFPVDPGR